MTTEPIELLYARLDERLKTIEREMGLIRAEQVSARTTAEQSRPQWTSITSALVAVAALVVTLIVTL